MITTTLKRITDQASIPGFPKVFYIFLGMRLNTVRVVLSSAILLHATFPLTDHIMKVLTLYTHEQATFSVLYRSDPTILAP